jgi:hypothetical protein
VSYIHKNPDWPNLRWDDAKLLPLLADVIRKIIRSCQLCGDGRRRFDFGGFLFQISKVRGRMARFWEPLGSQDLNDR